MSTTTMSQAVHNIPPTTAEPPPIAKLLPSLWSALAGSSLLFRFGIRLLLATVYPLHIIWSIVYAFLSPIVFVLQITLDVVLFTPFSILRTVAVALYPVYVFCAVACIFGASVGIFGHYVSTAILGALARSTYFTQQPSPPSSAIPPATPQVTLRKRKRKSVRLQ